MWTAYHGGVTAAAAAPECRPRETGGRARRAEAMLALGTSYEAPLLALLERSRG